MGCFGNNRRAKFYAITAAGAASKWKRRRSNGRRLSSAVALIVQRVLISAKEFEDIRRSGAADGELVDKFVFLPQALGTRWLKNSVSTWRSKSPRIWPRNVAREARRQASSNSAPAEGLKETCREERSGHWFDSFRRSIVTACAGCAKSRLHRRRRFFAGARHRRQRGDIHARAASAAREIHVAHPDELRMLKWAAGKGGAWCTAPGAIGRSPEWRLDQLSLAYPVYQDCGNRTRRLATCSRSKNLNRITSDGEWRTGDRGRTAGLGKLLSGTGRGAAARTPDRTGRRRDDWCRAVVVISDGYWARRFSRSPEVIGKTISLNGSPSRSSA